MIEQRDEAHNSRFDRIESSIDAVTRAMDVFNQNLERLERVSQLSSISESTSATTNTTYQPFQVHNIKLDFPRFDGSEPLNWIFKAEQLFSYYSTPDEQRLTIVAVHMEGSVVPWYQMMQKAKLIPNWTTLSRAIELQFGPSQFECPQELSCLNLFNRLL